MARIDAFFKLMSEEKASDLHLATNNPPMLRINGDLVRVDYPPLVNDELKALDPKVQIVLSSGFAEQTKLGSMLARGLCGFIPKPYTAEKLLDQVSLIIAA